MKLDLDEIGLREDKSDLELRWIKNWNWLMKNEIGFKMDMSIG